MLMCAYVCVGGVVIFVFIKKESDVIKKADDENKNNLSHLQIYNT